MNRMGLKIGCLIVSMVIWIQVASNSEVEQVTNLPLRIVGLEGRTVEGSDIPRHVRVRLRGSKLRLFMHRYFNRYLGEVRVDLADRTEREQFSLELMSRHVITDLQDAAVLTPKRLRLRVDDLMQRRLPVELRVGGALREGLGFLRPATVTPDSVLVTGPGRFFDDIDRVATAPLDLSRVQEPTTVELALVSPREHLQLSDDDVAAEVLVGPLLERTMGNVPVVALVDVGQPEVGVSPPLADVMVRGVADSVRALTESRISVTVPVGGLTEGIYRLVAQVDSPPWVTLLGIDPPEFQVIVGHPPGTAATDTGSGEGAFSDADSPPEAAVAGRRVTMVAAGLVLLLALAALLWPRGEPAPGRDRLLVFDPSGSLERERGLYPDLAAYLAVADDPPPLLTIARTTAAFGEALAKAPAYVLCPDGLALELDPRSFTALAVGRRAAPRNLRPRGVLVYRKRAGLVPEPWRTHAARTVLGDSLSLAATGAWRASITDEAAPPVGTGACAWGPDPYDHRPVLHAARLGAYDYAVVRQWDAEDFIAGGLLDPLVWGVEPLTPPVPDMLLLASRAQSAGARLATGEKLAALGRHPDSEAATARALRLSLDSIGLVGFNLLIDRDFEGVRRSFPEDWPLGGD